MEIAIVNCDFFAINFFSACCLMLMHLLFSTNSPNFSINTNMSAIFGMIVGNETICTNNVIDMYYILCRKLYRTPGMNRLEIAKMPLMLETSTIKSVKPWNFANYMNSFGSFDADKFPLIRTLRE